MKRAGSAGGIGQPLALLLKMQPYVTELALYDIANVVGIAADLSHCNTPTQVQKNMQLSAVLNLPSAYYTGESVCFKHRSCRW